MKWGTKPPAAYSNRTVSRYLYFPKTIGHETRWLEHATWVQVAIPCSDGMTHWFDDRWGCVECPHGYEDWDQCAVCNH